MGSVDKTPEDGNSAEWERHKIIIAAAVAAIAGKSEIREIRLVRHANTWIRHGRMTIQGSHDVSRQRGISRRMPDRRG